MSISRRDFIKYSSLSAFGLALTTQRVFSIGDEVPIGEDNDRILVLVQLQGGNDGLASIFDMNQYSNLYQVRENVIIPEDKIISFSGDYKFHPALFPFKSMWDNEEMGIIQNVGYPNQNRSHFRSSDIWHSASNAEDYISTGWLGRMYDLDFQDYPQGFPNNEYPHPFAITMGNIISETCQGETANYSMAVMDPFNPGSILTGTEGDIPDNCYGDQLTFLNETAKQTNAYAEVISEAANKGNNLSGKYDEYGNSELGEKFKHVARLISGGLQTKIYIVQLGGFDTHDNQVVTGATDTGRHSDLLKELSEAIDAFQDDINLLGLKKRVFGMTYSEFGRRIRSNGGLGTDHGTAAPMFLFGGCVKNAILGDSPEIDPEVGIQEGVPMQYDFRDVYGTVFQQWLGIEESTVKDLIYKDYTLLPIFDESCINATSVEMNVDLGGIKLYPSPASNFVQVDFNGMGRMNITIFDSMGGTVRVLADTHYSGGRHSIRTNIETLRSGSYFIHFKAQGLSKTVKFVKI